MSKTRWIIFAAVCVLVLGGLVALANRNKANVDTIDPSQIFTKNDANTIPDHVYGNKDAKVVVFEYGDFQCPSCGAAYPQIKSIKEAYKDQIAFVFRDFPLTSIHPNALSAATAAETASIQGKFWEMHDKLYDNQNSWSSSSTNDRNSIFSQYANDIGINTATFQTDFTSKKVADKISRDRALARKLGLDSTPSVMIGSEKMDADTISNLVNGDGSALKAKIDALLRAAGVASPKAQ